MTATLHSSNQSRWLQRSALWLLLLSVLTVAGMNLVLNLPLTQTLINQVRPEKFEIHWQRAWSLWPGNLRLNEVRISGRTSSIAWSVESERLDTSVNLFALLNRTLALTDTRAVSPKYAQRRIVEAESESDRRTGGDPQKNPGRAGWRIRVSRAMIVGKTTFSLPRLAGALNGDLAASIRYQIRGGALEISAGTLDVAVESLTTGDGSPLISRGRVRGEFALGPYVPRDHRGKQALNHLSLDSRVEVDADSLGFLDPYLARFRQLSLSGAGRIDGQVRLDAGRVLPGSGLQVSAPNLHLALFGFRLEGGGNVVLGSDNDRPERMSARVQFERVSGYGREPEALLLVGQNLTVTATASSEILFDKTSLAADGSIGIELGRIAVPDISVYQRYLPSRLGLQLKQGSGHLSGEFSLDQQRAAGQLTLKSDQAEIEIRDLAVRSDLELVLKATIDSLDETSVNLEGSAIHITETDVGTDSLDDGARTPFAASLVVEKGRLDLDGAEFVEGAQRWRKFVRNRDVDAMLENAAADLKVTGRVTSLEWLNGLINNPYGLALEGAGALNLELKLEAGMLKSGTRVNVKPEDLEIRLLDYLITGQGSVSVAAEGDPDALDLILDLDITNAELGRQGDAAMHVSVDQILLDATATGVGEKDAASDMDLRLQIPAARVSDMQVYNSYLPDASPLRFTDGEATLTVDVMFEPDNAEGQLALKTSGLRATLDDQKLAAELAIDVTIAGGVPADMEFDVSGTRIRVDQVRVEGAAADFDDSRDGARPPWRVELVLDEATVNWNRPLKIQTEARLTMSDTRPMVAVFANNRGKDGWLEKLLVIENVAGEAVLSVTDRKILVSRLMITGEDVEVGAKAVFEGAKRAGVVYARYKKLNGLLKFNGEKRNFDILGAREQFDRYDPATATPGESGPAQRARSAAASKQWQPFEHLR